MDTQHIDPNQIQFLFEPLKEMETLGSVTFFRYGRVPGSLALGNQLFRYDDAFDFSFQGYRAKNPGLVAEQNIRVRLNGRNLEYRWNHSLELARSVFGDRPIIEIETPTGEILLFSYRPMLAVRDGDYLQNAWARVIPTLWDSPLPYGFMGRHWDRVFFFMRSAIFSGLMFGFLGVPSVIYCLIFLGKAFTKLIE